MTMFRTFAESTVKLSCAHHLTSMPEGHKCGRAHGHTYHVTVRLSCAGLDEHGMVMDFGLIKTFLRERVDHQDLNEVFQRHGMEEIETTAENLCHFFFELLLDGPVRKANVGRERDMWVELERLEIQEGDGGKAWIQKT